MIGGSLQFRAAAEITICRLCIMLSAFGRRRVTSSFQSPRLQGLAPANMVIRSIELIPVGMHLTFFIL